MLGATQLVSVTKLGSWRAWSKCGDFQFGAWEVGTFFQFSVLGLRHGDAFSTFDSWLGRWECFFNFRLLACEAFLTWSHHEEGLHFVS